MYLKHGGNRFIRFAAAVFASLAFIIGGFGFSTCKASVYATPFYGLAPKETVLRAQFYTSYTTSTPERKANISLAAKSLDNVMVAPDEEFSFNLTVGERTERRGYKVSKIIVNGEFVDGVGGGVCQVSTTLYNAVLLAGLDVIEYHPHSLPVSYVAPSFDAMVNSGWADLKFINHTDNPVIIRAYADGATLRVEVYGEPMVEKYSRKSTVTAEIPAPESEVVFDELGEYPDLYEGESKVVKYGKAGYKSEGYLIVTKNGKLIGVRKIRSDSYSAIRGKVVYGKAVRSVIEENEEVLGENLPDFICPQKFMNKVILKNF